MRHFLDNKIRLLCDLTYLLLHFIIYKEPVIFYETHVANFLTTYPKLKALGRLGIQTHPDDILVRISKTTLAP